MEDVAVMNEQDLAISRKEMTENLTLFFTHVKYTMTLMLTVFTAALAILGFGIKEFNEQENFIPWLILAASFILIMVWVVGKYSESLVRRYYKLYVSSYVYAARVHDKHSVTNHPWLSEIKSRVKDIYCEKAVEQFIEGDADTDSHSWYYYRKIIRYVGGISLFVGVLMLLCFLWYLQVSINQIN